MIYLSWDGEIFCLVAQLLALVLLVTVASGSRPVATCSSAFVPQNLHKMKVALIFSLVFLLVIAVKGDSNFFRLKAHFPRQPLTLEKTAKKSVCKYCSYDTKYYEQKVDNINLQIELLAHNEYS